MATDRRDVVPEPSPFWTEHASCRGVGPRQFFAEEHAHYEGLGWVGMCAGCPVRAECLATALLADERWGVWGGFTPRARGRLLAQLLEETISWRHLLGSITTES
jgi:WhiB family redox-sensing transcriptional regulator